LRSAIIFRQLVRELFAGGVAERLLAPLPKRRTWPGCLEGPARFEPGAVMLPL